MGRIVTLIVVLAVVYFAYTQGLPVLKQRLGLEPQEDVGGSIPVGEARCVETAGRANRTLGQQVRQFARPPADSEMWSISYQQITGDIGAAEAACAGCLSEACRKATAAVSEMRSLAMQIDDTVRGDLGGMSNPATKQERINRLLDEARSLASF